LDETVEKEKVTMGFAVSGAPLWLCKALFAESKEYHANVYWPTIVDWYRKAKAFERNTGSVAPESKSADVEIVDSPASEVSLLGGHRGE